MSARSPTEMPITPSQTVGPFFACCLTPRDYGGQELASSIIATEAAGPRVRIEGKVYDGNGDPVPDAMVEAWQADASGRYAPHGAAWADADFRGFGRCESGKSGDFWFATIKPGRVPGPDGGLQAPHLNLHVFARGLLRPVFTRIYFADERSNASDPILALVPQTRRHTLLAQPVPGEETAYRFDIRLQGGDDETVFFET